MRRVIGGINVTMDGFCEHTAMLADEELHHHYATLLSNAGTLLYGRITYQLMESYWPSLVKNPSGDAASDEFAVAIDNVPKIVFSNTLQHVNWATAQLAKKDLQAEVLELKEQPGRDIFAGSRSIIMQLLNLNLLDEFQLCIHPLILANGSVPLFQNLINQIDFNLINTKTFQSGAIVLYYQNKNSLFHD